MPSEEYQAKRAFMWDRLREMFSGDKVKIETHKPSCFLSNPGAQAQAENDCRACPSEGLCAPRVTFIEGGVTVEERRDIQEYGNLGSTDTRTALYTAVVAERDALLALCEGMAGALDKLNDECDDIISRANHQIKHCRLDGHNSEESHQEGRIQAAIDISRAIEQALAAYEKHKEQTK